MSGNSWGASLLVGVGVRDGSALSCVPGAGADPEAVWEPIRDTEEGSANPGLGAGENQSGTPMKDRPISLA